MKVKKVAVVGAPDEDYLKRMWHSIHTGIQDQQREGEIDLRVRGFQRAPEAMAWLSGDDLAIFTGGAYAEAVAAARTHPYVHVVFLADKDLALRGKLIVLKKEWASGDFLARIL